MAEAVEELLNKPFSAEIGEHCQMGELLLAEAVEELLKKAFSAEIGEHCQMGKLLSY